MTDRILVNGPAGPFYVHPKLVAAHPDRYVPVTTETQTTEPKKPSKTTRKPAPAEPHEGETDGNLDHDA